MSNVNMDSNKQAKNDEVSLLKGGGMRRLSVFGKHSDLDMVSWIKGLALDPCSSVASPSSIRPLWNQTIKVRKLMALSSAGCPRVSTKFVILSIPVPFSCTCYLLVPFVLGDATKVMPLPLTCCCDFSLTTTVWWKLCSTISAFFGALAIVFFPKKNPSKELRKPWTLTLFVRFLSFLVQVLDGTR